MMTLTMTVVRVIKITITMMIIISEMIIQIVLKVELRRLIVSDIII